MSYPFREGEIVVVMFDGYRIIGKYEQPESGCRGWHIIRQLIEVDSNGVLRRSYEHDDTFTFPAAEEFIARIGDPLPDEPMKKLMRALWAT